MVVYGIFLLHGLWLYALCVPREKTDLSSFFTLAPVLGLSAISLYYANAVALSVPFSTAKPPWEAATALFVIVALWRRGPYLAQALAREWREARGKLATYAASGILMTITFALLAPILGHGPTTPWRIGPDAAGYTNCAKFLLGNKTLKGISGKFTSPTEIYAYEFMVQTFRRGYAAAVASIANLLGMHPGQIIFTVTAVLYFLTIIAAIRLSRIFLAKRHPLFPYVIGAAVAFNCNLLFILFEGGYAQIAALPLILTLVLWQYGGIPIKDSWERKVILGGILVGAATELYLESMLVIPVILSGYWIADGIARRRLTLGKRDMVILAGAVLVAFGLDWDVMSHWFNFERANSSLLSIAGWAQPQWAFFPEIMGWVNIYRHVVGNVPGYVNPVGPWANAVSLEISMLLAGFLIAMLLLGRRAGGLALIPSLIIGAAFGYFKLIRHVHSYSYMKIYTLVLPLLAVGCLASLLSVRRYRYWTSVSMIVLSFLAILNGALFIRRYRGNYAFLPSGLLTLKNVEENVDLSGYVLLSLPDTDQYSKIREIFIRSFFSSKMIHPGFFPQQDFSEYRSYPVALLLRLPRKDSLCPPQDTLWRNGDYVILNTGVPVENAWKDKTRIPWKPQPTYIPSPEIEIRWTSDNNQNNAALDYSFSKYFEKSKTCG